MPDPESPVDRGNQGRTQLDFLGFPSDFEEGEMYRVTLLNPDGRRVVLMAE